MILSSAHFPPIQYFSKLIDAKEVFIEACENYQKQSWRNRFTILAANGPLNLYIPLVKGRSPGQNIKDIQIDYTESWNKVHLKSIVSAYNHSPFYEFYIDDLLPYWEKKWKYLFDLNMNILDNILGVLELDISLRETSDFKREYQETADHRYTIHPKIPLKDDIHFKPFTYPQTFSDRHGFISNLSILDLLFQKGPESREIIKKSRKP